MKQWSELACSGSGEKQWRQWAVVLRKMRTFRPAQEVLGLQGVD